MSRLLEYPVLRKLGKQDIRKFLLDGRAYVREIEERNKQAGEAKGTPVSLAFSIEASLLDSLVDLRRLGEQIDTTAKATDAVLQQCLETHSDVKKDGLSAAQVHSLVAKKLGINMGEKTRNSRSSCFLQITLVYSVLTDSHG
jgi:hypothetical protein